MSDTEHGRRIVRKPGGSTAAAPDRRVRRTRKLLHDAFISLAIEKGYEKTTIQDILDRADVGRSTFYVHYPDKEALLTASFDEMHEQLERQLADVPATSPVDVALPAALLFEHAYRNQRVYRALCGHQGGAVGPAPSTSADRRSAAKAPAAPIQPDRHRGARRHCGRVLYLCHVGLAGVVDRPRILQRTDLVGRDIPNARAPAKPTTAERPSMMTTTIAELPPAAW